jgi:hypothetical protein
VPRVPRFYGLCSLIAARHNISCRSAEGFFASIMPDRNGFGTLWKKGICFSLDFYYTTNFVISNGQTAKTTGVVENIERDHRPEH